MSGMLQLRSRCVPGADRFLPFSRGIVVVSAVLILLLSAPVARAQQLWNIDHDVIFIPQDGLALNAHSGRLLWRWPRFQGPVVTDGHGLLVVSYLSSINHITHLRGTSVCRLNTRSGRQLWCREFLQLSAWVLDTSWRYVYVQREGRLDVLDIADGHLRASFPVRDRDSTLYPLPRGGVLLLDNQPARTLAGFYHPGDRAPQWRDFPMYLHPFQGNGHGLLLYASEQGEFFLPGLEPLYRRPPASEGFPIAGSDDQGFIFTDRQGPRPVLRGGTYSGPLWQSDPIQQQPSLLVQGGNAIVLEPLQQANAQTRLHLFDLATGHLRLQLDLPAGLRATTCDTHHLLLQGEQAMVLVDLASGAVAWKIKQMAESAVLTSTAVVFWNGQGRLLGRARSNGALLWRDRFQFDPLHPQ